MPRPGRGNFEHLLAELPKWARTVTYAFFIYALLNFVHFIFATCQYPKHEVPSSVELRGFSGHWMMFYGIAALGFVALGRLARKRRQTELETEPGAAPKSGPGTPIGNSGVVEGPPTGN
jgi:hypothetical protein